jgi:plasmid stabilization system protein ParE
VVRWSDQAKADLKGIHDYIARDSTHYAKQVTRELVDKADGLTELPRLGRVVPELGVTRTFARSLLTSTASSTRSRPTTPSSSSLSSISAGI